MVNFVTAYSKHDATKFFTDPGDEPSMTQQHMAADCDINNIMSRFEKTGLLEHTNVYKGEYGDFADAVEYHEAMDMVIAAQDMFMSLPATIRARFDNDPSRFLDFVDNPQNRSEMASMGLLPQEASDVVSESNVAPRASGEAARSEPEANGGAQ